MSLIATGFIPKSIRVYPERCRRKRPSIRRDLYLTLLDPIDLSPICENKSFKMMSEIKKFINVEFSARSLEEYCLSTRTLADILKYGMSETMKQKFGEYIVIHTTKLYVRGRSSSSTSENDDDEEIMEENDESENV